MDDAEKIKRICTEAPEQPEAEAAHQAAEAEGPSTEAPGVQSAGIETAVERSY